MDGVGAAAGTAGRGQEIAAGALVAFTPAGVLQGVRRCLPLVAGLTPYGLVAGVVAQGHGLSLAEAALMSAAVFAGAGQIMALDAWTHPASLVAASLACFAVNLRMVLVGPVLSPWLDGLRGWRLWGSLFVMTDLIGALSLTEMRAGGTDAGFLLGAGLVLWAWWVLTSAAGFLVGAAVQPPPGHPLFFAVVAAFVAVLVPMWRGVRRDLLPWAVAAAVAFVVSQTWPGSYWHIVVGALAGSLAGALRDRRQGAAA